MTLSQILYHRVEQRGCRCPCAAVRVILYGAADLSGAQYNISGHDSDIFLM